MESFVGINPHSQTTPIMEVIQNFVADKYDVDVEATDPSDAEFLSAHFWTSLENVMQRALAWEKDPDSPYSNFVFTYPRYVLCEATPIKTMSMKTEGMSLYYLGVF